MKAAVLGAGSWGTALANVLANNGHSVRLWARRSEIVAEVNQIHTNQRYLPGATLAHTIQATDGLEDALSGAELVFLVTPSASISDMATRLQGLVPQGATVAHAIKGFDGQTGRRISTVLVDDLGLSEASVCVVSGPSHAEEVVRRMPTTIVVSSSSRASAERVQDALMNPDLRVYTNPDVVGTELGGSLKNIIALGVGVADGLGLGDNARAALMTRGLAEIARLGIKMGASPLTFAGLSGVGDLIVTCTSVHSRNFRTGRLLGQGKSLEEALGIVGMAVEGIPTTKTTVRLAQQFGVEMPIAEALSMVLFEGKAVHEAVDDLMGRARSHEIEEVAKVPLAVEWKQG